MDQRPAIILTDEEAVTLRRVAFGLSEVRALRANDLARLRALRLIEDAKDGPRLTLAGKAHFELLPKAAILDSSWRFGNSTPDSRRAARPPSRQSNRS